MQNTPLPHNFFAIAYKMPNISSLSFANALKSSLKKMGYPIQKIGFSGTLDPFAHGTILLGINGYTKLLPHINKRYKTYRAVLFLGLESRSLDIENIVKIHEVKPFCDSKIQQAIQNLCGTITYKPPKFSAKHINGVRAYELMRKEIDFDIQAITTEIVSLQILNYSHPFLSFEVCMSEGGYVRSIGKMIADNLCVHGSLCSLERIQEGEWHYKNLCRQENMQSINIPIYRNSVSQFAKVVLLNIKNVLKYDTICLANYAKEAYNGAKFILPPSLCIKIFDSVSHNATTPKELQKSMLKKNPHNNEAHTKDKDSKSKIVLADFGSHYGIIRVFCDGRFEYILNRIDRC